MKHRDANSAIEFMLRLSVAERGSGLRLSEGSVDAIVFA